MAVIEDASPGPVSASPAGVAPPRSESSTAAMIAAGRGDHEPRGLVALYAARAAESGADLRPIIDARRQRVGGAAGRSDGHGALLQPPLRVGRGTPAHRAGRRSGTIVRPALAPRRHRFLSRRRASSVGSREFARAWRSPARRRLIVAAVAALALLAGLAGTGLAQERYRVQSGDTVDGIAARFGVDSAAILAASYVPDPSSLAAGDVLVIPDPSQSPSDAARDAAARDGASPWVADRYTVVAGDTIEQIAATYGVTPAAIADLNGLDHPDNLDIGQRLLIPPSDGAGGDTSGGELRDRSGVGSFISGVPTHRQEHNLSCEYAAAFIATSAFGGGVPEQVFLDSIPQSANPHWGYRGNIDGWWGNIGDYGVYPEAMEPILNDQGFADDIFYSHGDTGQLKDEIDAGHPVLVWIGEWGNTDVRLHDDGTYKVAAGDHVLVAYGYDDNGVYFSDPAKAGYMFLSWGDFIDMWTVLDGMSMAVYPG